MQAAPGQGEDGDEEEGAGDGDDQVEDVGAGVSAPRGHHDIPDQLEEGRQDEEGQYREPEFAPGRSPGEPGPPGEEPAE